MNADKQYKESSSRAIQPKQGGRRLSFVDNRPNIISTIVDSRNTLQCYRMVGNFKISENNIFKTNIRQSSFLWVKNDNAVPISDQLELNERLTNGYDKYTYHVIEYTEDHPEGNFRKDCGWLATFLTSGKRDARGLQVGGFPLLFNSDYTTNATFRELIKSNPEIRAQFGENENANPNIGEAYFMGRTGARYKGCHYHAAAVIAKDGSDNITCEADAGSQIDKPVFDMYGIQEHTFHNRYAGSYSTLRNPAITAVARPIEE